MGTVGPVGTLETEIQASQAGNFSRNFETSCLASLDLGLQSTHTTRVPNIDTFDPGLPFLVLVYLYSLPKSGFAL